MAALINMTRVAPAYPLGVFVQWEYGSEAVGEFQFKIERSGSPEGPWTQIGPTVINQVTIFDDYVADPEEANALAVDRSVWYRVTMTPPTGAALTTVPMNVDGELANDWIQADLGPGLLF